MNQDFAEIKVNFLIAGTQKGGTSALDAYLREHPEICMAEKKELHFFDDENNFLHDSVDYSRYHSCFNPRSSEKLLGEATPIYVYWYDSPKRIWYYNPEVKLIIILRDPIERAYSHWNMERDRKADRISFRQAIINETERCREALPYQHRVYSYVDRGFYVEQLRRIWTYFPKRQTLILRSEDLKTNPKDTLTEVCHFLGINNFVRVQSKNEHSRSYLSSMARKEWEYLRNIFEYEVRNLERVLDWDCSDWLKAPEFNGHSSP